MKSFKPKMGSGDCGYTDVFSARVPKTDLRVVLNAFLDETQAVLGVARARTSIRNLKKIQKDLLTVSAFVAGYEKKESVKKLSDELSGLIRLKAGNFKLKGFILFGEKEGNALLNLARTKVRLAEILAWKAGLRPVAVYLNRLADYLFILSAE